MNPQSDTALDPGPVLPPGNARPHLSGNALACAGLLVLLAAAGPVAWGQTAPAPGTPATTTSEATIVPQVQRRELKLPRIPSKDIEVGVLAGVYNAQNFGASGLAGLRLGYHLTEDFFVEGEFGRTTVSDDSFRAILPGGVIPATQGALSYGTLSLGWNFLPGEVFLGSRQARQSQFYLLGGIGSTDFVGQKRQTINLGVGLKVFATQRLALRVDMRDHLYTLDLLGQRERTHNLQLGAGLSYFF
ncbi:MAG: outer membrane beta-barrel domain-containing protein [Rubrivivax sp.]|nr:outer membrane beta-barrel domain-containing protein [Rubrivivax sp.]